MRTHQNVLKVQKWGNSLAIRIPSEIAHKAHLQLGALVEVTSKGDSVILTPTGEVKLTLANRLAKFDPQKHGGEAMATQPIGKEKL